MTQTSKTIRKNSKEYNAIMNSTSLTVYTLSNCFIGENVSGVSPYDRTSRVTLRNGIYTIHVHSNLWYTTEAKA